MNLSFNLDLPAQTGLTDSDSGDKVYQVAILGGGPAGMTAAVYLARKQVDTLMLTPELGGQVMWTTGIENYMGYQYITGPELSKKFSEQITQFPIKLGQGESAGNTGQQQDGLFVIRTKSNKTFLSRALIIATGKRSRELNVPGEQEYRGRGVSYCSICDGPFFKGKSVIVAGGGNSAATAALEMIGLNSPVTMINTAKEWQADPVLMDKIRGRAELITGSKVTEIRGDGHKVTEVVIEDNSKGEKHTVAAEGIFVEVGLIPNTEAFSSFVECNERGEVKTDCYTRTSRPGVYAAGDCTTVPDKQIIIAAGDGAKAALAAYRFINQLPIE